MAASGVKGLEALTITLDKEKKERTFTVRLHFAEPDSLKVGQRVFNVALQERTVLKDFDIVQEAGGKNRMLVKEFTGVRVRQDLHITFTGTGSQPPLLCGIEIVAEEK